MAVCFHISPDIAHPSDGGPASGLFPGVSISSAVLIMSSGFLRHNYVSIPTVSPFGNMSYNWLYFRSLSNLLNPYIYCLSN